MHKLKWYHVLLLVLGGLAVLLIAYALLRSTGVIDRLTTGKEKWIEQEE